MAQPHFCPVFHPTKAEFSRPFCEYVSKVMADNPDLPMFKVVPPAGWQARTKPFPRLDRVQIACPIQQLVFGTRGAYRCVLVEQKPTTVSEFRKLANDDGHKLVHKERDAADSLMERAFWSSVTINPPLYGADTPQSFFDEELPYGWNLRHLDDVLAERGVPDVPGVTTPMTYFGMWKSFFAWHVEDADLMSVNYLHFGAAKVWYCVPPSQRAKFEAMAATMFPELRKGCPAFMRHKDILFSPSMLRTYNIEYLQTKQEAGEFVVLNSRAYHAGFNHGFNCAEAVNFATLDWIPIGQAAVKCNCSALKDCVQIDMGLFRDSGSSSSDGGSSSSSSGEESGTSQTATSSLPGGRDSVEQAVDEDDAADVTSPAAPARGGHSAGQGRGRGGAATAGGKRPVGRPPAAGKRPPGRPPAAKKGVATKRRAATAAVPAPVPKLTVVRRAPGLRKLAVVKVAAVAKPASNSRVTAARKAAAAITAAAKKAGRSAAGSTAAAPAAAAGETAASRKRARKDAGAPDEPAADQRAAKRLHADAEQQPAGVAPDSSTTTADKAGAPSGSKQQHAPPEPSDAPALHAPPTPEKWPQAGSPSTLPPAPGGRQGGRRRAAVKASEVADEQPQAILGTDKHGNKVFWLVQRLKRRPSRKGLLVLQWLREEQDGLFRGSDTVWEENQDSLVPVRTQRMAAGGGFKLLTLRSRILSTQLVE